MEIRKLNAARGWLWVKHGYQLIARDPLLSIVLALVGAITLFVALKVPFLGSLFAVMLMPILLAGYARVCRALEENEDVELAHLFAGLSQHARPLIALGGTLMLGLLISSIAMMSVGGEALVTLLGSVQAANDPQLLIDAMWTAGSGVAFSLMVGFALMFALMLAFQYAPMLVFFSNVPPFAALRISLIGSVRNLIPYTVYSLVMQLVALVLSLIPYNIGLILLLPLGLTSLYVSYRNIFPFADEITVNPPAQETAA